MIAAPHHPHAGSLQQAHVAPRVQPRRRIGDLAQQRRERGIVKEYQGSAEPVQLIQNLPPRRQRAGAHRAGPGTTEAGKRRDGAVRCSERRAPALKRRNECAQPRGPDPRELRQREIRGYLVAAVACRDCHRVSSRAGTPSPLTADIRTTGAPAAVRISGCWVSGARRSALVTTTTCGFVASSAEYAAASRRNSS